jgi:hypothetical protein
MNPHNDFSLSLIPVPIFLKNHAGLAALYIIISIIFSLASHDNTNRMSIITGTVQSCINFKRRLKINDTSKACFHRLQTHKFSRPFTDVG